MCITLELQKVPGGSQYFAYFTIQNAPCKPCCGSIIPPATVIFSWSPKLSAYPYFACKTQLRLKMCLFYPTKRPMQTLQLQLQLFNNTTRDGHFKLKPQAIDLPLFCLQNATYLTYFAWHLNFPNPSSVSQLFHKNK